MSTEFKRFTVSVTPELEKKLDKAKKERYYNQPQSQMVRDLIARGLAAIEHEPVFCNEKIECKSTCPISKNIKQGTAI